MLDDQVLGCPLPESMDTLVFVDKQRMSTSDCKDKHTDLDLCSHMTKDFFSNAEHHIL